MSAKVNVGRQSIDEAAALGGVIAETSAKQVTQGYLESKDVISPPVNKKDGPGR